MTKKIREKKSGDHSSFSFLVSHLSAASKLYLTSCAIAHFNDDVFRLVIKNKYVPRFPQAIKNPGNGGGVTGGKKGCYEKQLLYLYHTKMPAQGYGG